MSTSRMNSLITLSGRAASKTLLVAGLAVALGTGSAAACSLANWSTISGGIFASQPDGAGGDPNPSPASARYAGLCGSTAPAGAVNFVQDNRPGGIDRIIARFYVLNNGAANPVVYRGNNSGGTALFNVALTGGNAVFTAGGATVSAPTQTGWNSIEIDWDSGTSLGLIVNGGTPATSATAPPAGSLANVQLGNLNSANGSLTFDGYEAHLSTPVGRICNCNANGSADDAVNVQDVVVIVNEASGGGMLASGTPDCNEDGAVAVQDVVQTVNLASGTGACIL